jgi:glycosyltransferase involved in cell wall biosynthesis
MAAYNGAETIGKALDSVFAQTYTDFDVLVLDDGSSDDSADLARRAGCQVITVPNAGLGAARKRLVEETQHELIAFIDVDDFWLPEKLEKQVALLDETGAALVHADCWYLHQDGHIVARDLHLPANATAFDHILPNNKVIASSAVFRREKMMNAGNFVADTVRCSDWYGWLILAENNEFVHLPEKLVEYSVLDHSLANAGFRFYQAQHYLLTTHVLPRREQLFSKLPRSTRAKYTKMLVRDVGLALSGMARAKRAGGSPKDARSLAFNALRYAPDSVKVWGRALSCLRP